MRSEAAHVLQKTFAGIGRAVAFAAQQRPYNVA